MIFDLLTSPLGHQLDPRMKILLAFCSARHPRRFDMPHDHVRKKKFFDPLGTPSAPKSHPWGMTQATEWKSCLICLYLSFVRTHTKFSIKIFKIDFVIEIKWYLTFWPHPKVTSLTLGWKFFLHSVLLVIPVDVICHMTMFEKIKFLTPWAPPAPLSPTPGAWPRRQNKNSVWYVLFLSFVRTHTKFGIKIFKIDFVIEIKWYLTFWPLPRSPDGRAKNFFAVARPIHVSSSHTKFGWISSNGLGGDSITDRRTDGRTPNIEYQASV